MTVEAAVTENMSDEVDRQVATNALLTDILDVLKRIDGRLQTQDSRIESLEKIALRGLHGAASSSESTSIFTHDKASHTNLPRVSSRSWLRSRASMWEDDENQTSPSKVKCSSRNKSIDNETMDSSRGKLHSISKSVGLSRSGTWETVPPPSMESEQEIFSSDTKKDSTNSYAKYPPPWRWISTKNLGRHLDVQYGLPEAEALWNIFVGDSWTIPPDSRVELSFQQHLLERLNKDQAVRLLELLAEVFNKLEYQDPKDRAKRGSFKVSDFDIDPNYRESGVDYCAEFSTGIYKAQPLPHPRPAHAVTYSTAPWKRIM